MISDRDLERILDEAASSFVVGDDAQAAILAKARTPAREVPSRWERFRPRELALAGTSIAAVIALVVVLVTSSSSTAPVPLEYHAASGANGAPAAVAPTFAKSAAGPSSATPVPTSGRAIVATGTLRLTVSQRSLRGAINRLEGLAASLGGYVGHAAVNESGRQTGGSLVLDVPAKSFADLVSGAGRAGTIRSLSTSDQDVTGQVVDLGARLTALGDERSQLEVLLGKAGKISDLLAVENQIEFVQSQIEQIQGEQRDLAQQIDFSALTVDLAVIRPAVVSTTGFDHAWHSALSGFVSGVKAFVAHLGDIVFTALAVLVALALLLVLWRRAWPIVRRRLA